MRLAAVLDTEIIACDSMQIYEKMDVGTAKPTREEQAAVAHHMIDVLPPDTPFSCAEYAERALVAANGIHARGNLPMVAGGTGLYLDSLLFERPYAVSEGASELRDELAEFAKANGAHALWLELLRIDPESAEKTHENNVRRVVRALEIYRLTGVTKAEWDRRSASLQSPYNAAVLGLFFADRSLLYARIEQRVELMLQAGLVEETQRLLETGVFERSPTAAAAIGYKELLPYLAGESTLECAAEELKTATRRYAKRQLTWFGAKDYVQHLTMDNAKGLRKSEEIVNNAIEISQHAWNML
jgi:tRNA dimethylallyltransferase